MKHSILATLTFDTDNVWHVKMFGGKIRNSYRDQIEAVDFIENELERVMNDYGVEVCYRVEDKVLGRRSYVLLKRRDNGVIEHISMSRYEYSKTHFFFYSKDKRRKIFDYKNPSFNQLTRNCISTKSKINKTFISLMGLSVLVLAALLALFSLAMNNNIVQAIENTEGGYNLDFAMLMILSVSLFSAIVIFILTLVRFIRYSRLVKGRSVWHESYSEVDWRKFYKFSKIIRGFATFFSVAFALSIMSFGIMFTVSSMFNAVSSVPEVESLLIVFLFASLSAFMFAFISTYYIVRFRTNLHSIAPLIMTEHGIKMYKAWLKGDNFPRVEMEEAFHPINENTLYPTSRKITENPKFAELTDKQIKQLRLDVKNYLKLINIDKFTSHGANKDELAQAKARYQIW